MNSVVVEDARMAMAALHAEAADILAGKTVLIAGAGGLIARNIAYALLEEERTHGLGLRLVLLARDAAKAKTAFHDYAGGGLDIVQDTLGRGLTYDGAADFIIHAGGSSSPRAYRSDPLDVIRANVTGAFELLALGARGRTSRILFLSSREIYGRAKAPADRQGLNEGTEGVFDHLAPRNAYPESKRMTETILAAGGAQCGVPWNALRLAGVYGPGMPLEDDGRAMSDLIGAALRGEDLVLTSDGSAVRAYCYVADAISGILTVMLKGAPDTVYNIANESEPLSIRELAGTITTLPGCEDLRVCVAGSDSMDMGSTGGGNTSKATPNAAADSAYAYSDFPYTPLDTGLIRALGWAPRTGLAEGIARTLGAFREGF